MVEIIHIQLIHLFEWFVTIISSLQLDLNEYHHSLKVDMHNALINKQIKINVVKSSSSSSSSTIGSGDLFTKYKIPIHDHNEHVPITRIVSHCIMKVHVSKFRAIKRAKRNLVHQEEESTKKIKDYNDIMTNHVLMISKYTYHALRNQIFPGTYYAFLMSHSLKNKKKDTNIGFSKNPIYSLYLHNGQHIVNKNTSSAAPFWILDIILGPFPTEKQVMDCCNEWVSKTRGRESKRNKAYKLYKYYGVNLYSHQVALNEPYDQFLFNINAPLNYIKKTREILRK